jgi:hypothetical protein
VVNYCVGVFSRLPICPKGPRVPVGRAALSKGLKAVAIATTASFPRSCAALHPRHSIRAGHRRKSGRTSYAHVCPEIAPKSYIDHCFEWAVVGSQL